MNLTARALTSVLATIAILATMGCASSSTSKQRSTGEYIDDSVITTKVKAAIFNEPNLKSLEIKVATYDGVVQLSGFVSSSDAQARAVEITRRIDGVKSVENDLQLK
jgi:osmotically-inducible protein OsmY